MLSEILTLLQSLLLPLSLLVMVGVVAWVVWHGRRPTTRRASQRQPAAVQNESSPRTLAPATQVVQLKVAAALSPAPAPAPAPATAAATPQAARPCKPTSVARAADLLLVDDSAVVRAKLRRLFEPAGFTMALARDGVEALALLDQGRYALMVTDLEMPNLDGMGLIRALQAQPAHADMPILAITGHDNLQAQLHQLKAVTGIYRKPWVDDDLLGQVQALVQPSRADATITEPA